MFLDVTLHGWKIAGLVGHMLQLNKNINIKGGYNK
jgi:hypothetical protein